MEEIIFPNQIRMIRRTRGKTMKEIAAILGVSLSAISKIEKGYRRIDDKQLTKISTFLNCPKESIFVYEMTSQPEVLQAWEKEQERRKQINEKSGLKTLGAGLRQIRNEKNLSLKVFWMRLGGILLRCRSLHADRLRKPVNSLTSLQGSLTAVMREDRNRGNVSMIASEVA